MVLECVEVKHGLNWTGMSTNDSVARKHTNTAMPDWNWLLNVYGGVLGQSSWIRLSFHWRHRVVTQSLIYTLRLRLRVVLEENHMHCVAVLGEWISLWNVWAMFSFFFSFMFCIVCIVLFFYCSFFRFCIIFCRTFHYHDKFPLKILLNVMLHKYINK